MGQRIEIDDTTVVDDAAVFATNRSFTGTDGEGYTNAGDTEGVDTFPAKLAAELFESDSSLSRVYIDQNSLIVQRSGGWPSDALKATSTVIEDFFLYYG